MVHTVVYLSVGLLWTVPGFVFLYGSLRRDPRWSTESSAVRVVAVLTGVAWLVLGVAFIAAAWTSGSTSRDLLVAGGVVAVGCAAAMWLVRDHWERRTVAAHLEQNRRVEP